MSVRLYLFLTTLIVAILFTHGNKVSSTGVLTDRINHLLNITETENKFNSVLSQFILSDPSLSAFKSEIMAFINKFMSFQSLRPHIVKIYRDSYTLQDINGLIKFYSSALGRKLIKKESQAELRLAQLIRDKLQAQMPQITAWFEQMLTRKMPPNQLDQTVN